MSVLADTTSLLDRIALSSSQQQWLRVAVLVSGLGFLGLVPAAGGGFHPILGGAALLLLVLAVLMPESNAPLGLVFYLGGLWVVTVPRTLGVEVLLAAVVLTVLHLACALASYGPPGLTLDASVLALWWRRFWLCIGGGCAIHGSATAGLAAGACAGAAGPAGKRARARSRPRAGAGLGHRAHRAADGSAYVGCRACRPSRLVLPLPGWTPTTSSRPCCRSWSECRPAA